jgi:hypothetical protein
MLQLEYQCSYISLFAPLLKNPYFAHVFESVCRAIAYAKPTQNQRTMDSPQPSTSSNISGSVFRAVDKLSLPQVFVCHASALDLSSGSPAQFFDHWRSESSNSHVLSSLGRRMCVVDERCSRGGEFIELVHSLQIPHEYDALSVMRTWHGAIEEWFKAREWSSEELAQFNAVVMWLRRDSIEALVLGSARLHVAGNRLRIKNFISFDGAREFVQDRIKSRLHKKMTGKALLTKEDWSWDVDVSHEDAHNIKHSSDIDEEVLEENTLPSQCSCRYEEHILQGASRCVFLASDIWLPPQLDVLFRAGVESQGSAKRPAAEVHQAFATIGERPRGSVAVASILPQEMDTPDLDDVGNMARRASKAFKGAKGSSGLGKTGMGLLGKTVVAGLIIGGVVAAAAVIRNVYQQPQEQGVKRN